MAADGKLLLRVLLFQALVLGALCCSCIRTPPQDQFCRHEYALKVFVKGRSEEPHFYKTMFLIQIMKFFRGDATKIRFHRGRNVLLTMPRFCAIDYMKKGDTYLIFGSNVKGDIYTELCSGSMNWKYVKRTVRNNLYENIYKTGCKCAALGSEYGPCRWLDEYTK